MSLRTCAGCSTRYARDLSQCPHCNSAEYSEDGVTPSLPSMIQIACGTPGCVVRGVVRQFRIRVVQLGVVEMPNLLCASCACALPITWPPEGFMPKITVAGGPTNAREADPSPAADASPPPVVAEGDRGPLTSKALVGEPGPEVFDLPEPQKVDEVQDETAPEEDVDPYESLTLAELRTAADDRGLASYGTKAQIATRLREADQEV